MKKGVLIFLICVGIIFVILIITLIIIFTRHSTKSNNNCTDALNQFQNLPDDQIQQTYTSPPFQTLLNNCDNKNDFTTFFCGKKDPIDAAINWGCLDKCDDAFNEWQAMSGNDMQKWAEKNSGGVSEFMNRAAKCTSGDFFQAFCVAKGKEDGTKNWGCPANFYS